MSTGALNKRRIGEVREETMRVGRPAASRAQPLPIVCLAALLLIGLAAPTGATERPGTTAGVEAKLAKAHLVEPLIATVRTTTSEDRQLLRAVGAYEQRTDADNFRSL